MATHKFELKMHEDEWEAIVAAAIARKTSVFNFMKRAIMEAAGRPRPRPDAAASESSAGWRFPANARKAHYFDEGKVISLCGRWMYNGPSQGDGSSRSSDDCAACRRLLDVRVNGNS